MRTQASIVHKPFATFGALNLTLFTWSMNRCHVLVEAGPSCEIFRTNVAHVRFILFHVQVNVSFVRRQATGRIVTEQRTKNLIHARMDDKNDWELTICHTNCTHTFDAR